MDTLQAGRSAPPELPATEETRTIEPKKDISVKTAIRKGQIYMFSVIMMTYSDGHAEQSERICGEADESVSPVFFSKDDTLHTAEVAEKQQQQQQQQQQAPSETSAPSIPLK
ncbi:unnamed protein product [Gongylonema pulchrum]|uniref:Uncharacterized protein n=1 Tax=Gongylonema pulchrum TaxID=637853 RepID=A0A3P7NKW3_9BILA|nr:unnamed protein product [Gongylonema pulchrum]